MMVRVLGNDGTGEMRAESEQVKDEDEAAPEISAEILSHLAAHRSLGSSTGSSLPSAAESTAPFGYVKLGDITQDATVSRRCSTTGSDCDAREADLAVSDFVKELDAESQEISKGRVYKGWPKGKPRGPRKFTYAKRGTKSSAKKASAELGEDGSGKD